MDLGALRQAIAEQIADNVDSVVNVYAAEEAQMNTPAVLVQADPEEFITPHQTMRANGVALIRYRLLIRGSAVNPQDAIADMDAMLSYGADQPLSVIEALRVQGGPLDTFLGAPGRYLVSSISAPVADESGAQAIVQLQIQPPLED